MIKTILFIVIYLSVSISIIAQTKQKQIRSFQLENYLQENTGSKELISFFIKGNKREIEEQLNKRSGKLKGSINEWIFVHLPTNQVNDFLNTTSLTAINFRNYKGTPLNDTMRVNNRINAIHEAHLPLGTSYEGEGIIMGFIDTGLDWMHPDFLNPIDSSTRVLALWDQTKPINSFTPSKYGYGQDWDSSEIMQGLSTNNDQYGHGSTVTGSAAGNGFANGLNKGVAPKVEIIAVESNFSAPNWLGTVADAVEYIYHLADSLNKPCIINASLGTYLGSHDGLDPYALYIDSLISRKKGHLMVASAGNSGNWGNYHLHSSVSNDTAFTWFTHNPSSGVGGPAVFFEIWADTANFNQLEFAIGLDQVSPQFENRGMGSYFNITTNLGNVNYDTIKNSNQEQLATVQYWSELRDGQYLLQVYLPAPDSSQYNFRFETVGTGSFDSWSTSILGLSDVIDDTSGILNFSEAHKYQFPDSLKTIVSSFQCSPFVVTVGNYFNDSGFINLDSIWIPNGGVRGQLAKSSSKGPTRDNRLKPEISASGDGTQSAIPLSTINYYINHPTLDSTLALGGMHRRNGGTSMASPVVAGVGALLLEKCNKITTEDFINALANNAYSDSYTGTLPNYGFGYGKLDGFNTLVNFNYANTLAGTLEFCEGESNLITVVNDVVDYNWSDLESTSSILLTNSENYFLITTDSLGCKSDTLFFESVAQPIPNSPTLSVNFDSIEATGASNNQIEWYFNSSLITNETDSTLFAAQNGAYYLTITNQFGCSTTSDTVNYSTVGLSEVGNNYSKVFPNPAKDFLTIHSKEPILALALYDLNGRLIYRTENINQITASINILKLSNGIYYLKLFTSEINDVQKIVIAH
jgi:hypothetical protein